MTWITAVQSHHPALGVWILIGNVSLLSEIGIDIDNDLLETTKKSLETYVRMGERIGSISD